MSRPSFKRSFTGHSIITPSLAKVRFGVNEGDRLVQWGESKNHSRGTFHKKRGAAPSLSRLRSTLNLSLKKLSPLFLRIEPLEWFLLFIIVLDCLPHSLKAKFTMPYFCCRFMSSRRSYDGTKLKRICAPNLKLQFAQIVFSLTRDAHNW